MGVRRLGRLIRAGLLVWLATFAIVLAAQVFWPRALPVPERAEAVFCLGAGIAEGRHADASSAGRARTCAALHADGAAPLVVFTGYGIPGLSAAEAMADVARDAGLPERAIRVEPAARSTIQNAAFGLALLGAPPARVVVVSDAFHLPRAWVIFRVLGVREVALRPTLAEATPDTATMLRWCMRESLAIWFNAGRLAVYGIAGALGVDRETRIGWFN
ncbi:MAG: YdcF family protein [Roseicyclus sp.]